MLEARQIADALGLPVELVLYLIKARLGHAKARPGSGAASYAEYVRIPKAAELTGYTVKAIEQKIDSGVWAYGSLWTYTPLGERVIIMKGYHAWVESGRASPPVKRKTQSRKEARTPPTLR